MRASVVGSRAHVGRRAPHMPQDEFTARCAVGAGSSAYALAATAQLRRFATVLLGASRYGFIDYAHHRHKAQYSYTSPNIANVYTSFTLYITVVYKAPPASPGGAQLPRNISSPLRKNLPPGRRCGRRGRKCARAKVARASAAGAEATSVHPDARAVTCAVEAQSMCFVNCE